MSDPQVGEVWGVPGQPLFWRLVSIVATYEMIQYQEFGDNFLRWVTREGWAKWVRGTGAVCITKQLTEPGEGKR